MKTLKVLRRRGAADEMPASARPEEVAEDEDDDMPVPVRPVEVAVDGVRT